MRLCGVTLTGQIGSAMYQTFSTGIYTIIAADEWGEVVLLHFTVESS